MTVSPLTIAVALLKDIIGHPADRPYLSMMSVPAKLEIDIGSLCLFQIKRLVI